VAVFWCGKAKFCCVSALLNQDTVTGRYPLALWKTEANAKANNLRLFGLYNLPRISQVYIMFLGDLKDGYIAAGEESLEAALFDEKDIPWGQLAFPVVAESLKQFFKDRSSTNVHVADIRGRPGSDVKITRH